MSNNFSAVGHLGADVEVRSANSGTTVANFNVAVKTGFGERERTMWVRCALFGKRAESGLVQYLTKGREVFITGELSENEYQGNDGAMRKSLELNLNEVKLVGGGQNQGQQQAQGGYNQGQGQGQSQNQGGYNQNQQRQAQQQPQQGFNQNQQQQQQQQQRQQNQNNQQQGGGQQQGYQNQYQNQAPQQPQQQGYGQPQQGAPSSFDESIPF